MMSLSVRRSIDGERDGGTSLMEDFSAEGDGKEGEGESGDDGDGFENGGGFEEGEERDEENHSGFEDLNFLDCCCGKRFTGNPIETSVVALRISPS